MTTSFSSPQRGLDAGPIIYSLLSGHPASAICESYIRGHSGWFTTAATLLEVDAVLRKVYGVDPMLAAGKLAQFVVGPIVISAVDASLATSAMVCATHSGSIWETRSFCRSANCMELRQSARTTTNLREFARGLALRLRRPSIPRRRQIAAWESANLPRKGLARVLFQVRQWIGQQNSDLAQDFWNLTGGGSHLP